MSNLLRTPFVSRSEILGALVGAARSGGCDQHTLLVLADNFLLTAEFETQLIVMNEAKRVQRKLPY